MGRAPISTHSFSRCLINGSDMKPPKMHDHRSIWV